MNVYQNVNQDNQIKKEFVNQNQQMNVKHIGIINLNKIKNVLTLVKMSKMKLVKNYIT